MEYTSKMQNSQRLSFLTLLESQEFSDVTVVVGTRRKEFHVHRSFLAAISPVLRKSLYENKSRKIALLDVRPSAFQSIVLFAYANNPQITSENVVFVRFACQKLEITALSKFCDEYFEKCLTPLTLCYVLNGVLSSNVGPFFFFSFFAIASPIHKNKIK